MHRELPYIGNRDLPVKGKWGPIYFMYIYVPFKYPPAPLVGATRLRRALVRFSSLWSCSLNCTCLLSCSLYGIILQEVKYGSTVGPRPDNSPGNGIMFSARGAPEKVLKCMLLPGSSPYCQKLQNGCQYGATGLQKWTPFGVPWHQMEPFW